MKKIILFHIILFLSVAVHAQLKELSLEGKYYGESLFIYNPSVKDTFCVKYIVVNGDTLSEELESNALEIDFSLLEIENEADVFVQVVYDSICLPLIVNPNALMPPRPFKFSKPRVRENNLQWFVYGDVSDSPIQIQHKKWDEWITINEVNPLDTVRNNFYTNEVMLHSGSNEFRLHTYNLKGEEVYSKEINFKPGHIRPVTLQTEKVEKEIVFSYETEYELYSLDGKMVLKGKDRYVDVTELEKGSYYLKFDNRAVQIRKKK